MGVSQRPAINKAASRAAAEARRHRADATAVVESWNGHLQTGDALLFVPTIRAALLSGHHWLTVHCAGCDTVSDIDLRMVPRDPNLGVTQILPSLACRRCHGRGPLPRILRLARTHGEMP